MATITLKLQFILRPSGVQTMGVFFNSGAEDENRNLNDFSKLSISSPSPSPNPRGAPLVVWFLLTVRDRTQLLRPLLRYLRPGEERRMSPHGLLIALSYHDLIFKRPLKDSLPSVPHSSPARSQGAALLVLSLTCRTAAASPPLPTMLPPPP